MSSVLDFLFDGQQPTSTTTYGSSVTNVPTWLSDYTQGLISKANQVAAEGYQTYTGPRVAALTDDQKKAAALTESNTGKYDSTLQQASNLTQAGAAGLTPEQIASYQNPYTDNVIKKAEMEANRNYNENILPTLSNKFTASGQYGSTRMSEVANQAARDLTSTLQTNSNAALSDAYKTATSTAQQNAQNQLTAGSQLGTLASTGQTMGLKDAAALESVGATQQNQNQKNLDTAYSDFTNQTNYDKNNLDWLSGIIRGIQTPTSTTSTNTTTGTSSGSSGLSQVTGALDAISGLASLFGSAKGGYIDKKKVERYATGGEAGLSNPQTDIALTTDDALKSHDQKALSGLQSLPTDVNDDWYNHYGENPEYLFYKSPSTASNVLSEASGTTPASSSGAGLSAMQIIKAANNARNTYNKVSDLFDSGSDTAAGMDAANAAGIDTGALDSATSGVDLTSGAADGITATTPVLDVAGGAGLSSIAGDTLGTAYGLGSGAAGTAAGVAGTEGASSAAGATLGSQFGTTAAEAGLSGTGTAAGTTAAGTGAEAGSSAAGTGAGLGATGAAATAAIAAIAAKGWDEYNKGNTYGYSATQVNPYESILSGAINGKDAVTDLNFAKLLGDTNAYNSDDAYNGLWYKDVNGNWSQLSPEDAYYLPTSSTTPGSGEQSSGLQTLNPTDYGLPEGTWLAQDPSRGFVYDSQGNVYRTLDSSQSTANSGQNMDIPQETLDALAASLGLEKGAFSSTGKSLVPDLGPNLEGPANILSTYQKYNTDPDVNLQEWLTRLSDLTRSVSRSEH